MNDDFSKMMERINKTVVESVEVAHDILKQSNKTKEDREKLHDKLMYIRAFFYFAAGVQEMKRITLPFLYTLPPELKDLLIECEDIKLNIDYGAAVSDEERERVRKFYATKK